MPARLERSSANRMIAGVCGGIAEYLAVDVTLVRIVFALLAISGGIGLLAYILLVIIMPQPASATGGSALAPVPASTDAAPDAHSGPLDPPDRAPVRATTPAETARRREFAGYVLIAAGVVFLLANQGAFRLIEGRIIWPIAVIAVGILLIVQRARR